MCRPSQLALKAPTAVPPGTQSQGETKSREVELGSHRELDNHLRVQVRSRGGRWSWTLKRAQERSRTGRWSWVPIELNNPLLHLFLNSCFSDIVFVTLLRTSVETAISEVHKLLCTGGVPTSLLFWRWLTVSSAPKKEEATTTNVASL